MPPDPGPGPLWDPAASYERVALEGVTLDLPIGLHDWERVPDKVQRLEVSIELFRHRGAVGADDLAACLDYDRLASRLLHPEFPARAHTFTLEILAEELIALGLADPRVEACRVRVRKPYVYDGRGVPSIEVYRTRAEQGPVA